MDFLPTIELLRATGLEQLPLFAISLAIGLLIGLERERRPEAKAGLRTFALTALFGTSAALISERTGSPWFLVGGLLIVGLMTIAAYLREQNSAADPGTTTVAAIILCYGLGAMIWYGHDTLAVILAIISTVLLYFKAELRGWSQALTRRDLVSMLQFAVLTFVILPILPDRNYGPYTALNPHHIWLMVVLISGVSLAGYVALRLVGQRYGAPLLGLLGGLVSSTATTLVYARHGRSDPAMTQIATVVILLANLVVPLRLIILSAVVAPRLLPSLAPLLLAGFGFGLMGTLYYWRRLQHEAAPPILDIANPTELRTSLTFGGLYATVLLLSAWLSDRVGSAGVYALAAISGLTDVDAITLSSLRLFDLGNLSGTQAVVAIGLALMTNIAFKFGLIAFIGGAPLAKRCAIGLLAAASGIALAMGFLLIGLI